MIACIPCLCSYSHRSRSKVLYLLQVEIQPFGDNGKFSHIFFSTSRVTADEIRNDLLTQVQLLIYSVEDTFEAIELFKRRFTHDIKHTVAGMFRSHFQASTYMTCYQLPSVFRCTLVYFRILALVQQQIISDTASDKTLFNLRERIDSMINIQQRAMIGIQVRTYLRMDTRRAFAPAAHTFVTSVHAIHVCRRSSQIT